ncbi:MAG TPA: hypothetical protein VFP65_01825 [Anaeromyxobacteraceae bacterium]|nr:hypothetical protein [Anaeromyxobacteraceae bacterium]
MPYPQWHCSACGRTSRDVDRVRALTGRPALGGDALACSQRCALALVEQEIAAVAHFIERVEPALAGAGDGDEVDARAHVPRLAAYVALMSIH